MILERLQIDRVNFFIFPDALIKSLTCFVAEPFPFDHLLLRIGHQEAVAPGVIWNSMIKIRPDERPHIEPDNIQKAEAGRIRQPDQRPRDRIDLFDGVVALDGNLADRPAEKAADAVRDEVRRVFTWDHSFTEPFIAVVETNDRISGSV